MNFRKCIMTVNSLSLCLSLSSCAKTDSDTQSSSAPQETERTDVHYIPKWNSPDGWVMNKNYSEILSDQERELYDLSFQDISPEIKAFFSPIQLLGTKPDGSAMNYVYLAYKKQQEGTTSDYYTLYVIYDPNNPNFGHPRMNGNESICIWDIPVLEKPDTEILKWTFTADPKPGSLPPEADEAFSKAVSKKTDITLIPIVLLGTKDDAGTKYRFLCYGRADEKTYIYVTDVYQNEQGECEVTDNQLIDLLQFLISEYE